MVATNGPTKPIASNNMSRLLFVLPDDEKGLDRLRLGESPYEKTATPLGMAGREDRQLVSQA